LTALVVAFFALELNQYITLEYIQSKKNDFMVYYQSNIFTALLLFFCLYIIIAALSLPGAAILTILAGALFGFDIGVMIVSPASTLGATLSFLSARFLLADIVHQKFAPRINLINEGVKKEGAFYLFALRLVPVFPFFMVNILMGLTSIRTLTFAAVSLIGMLPGTMVYVYAGKEIANLSSLSDILSPGLLFSFALLGLFPLGAKKAVGFLRRRVYEKI
jgi:uncharacterized membrane protein YdjX (TVP38/TMEM64 family)